MPTGCRRSGERAGCGAAEEVRGLGDGGRVHFGFGGVGVLMGYCFQGFSWWIHKIAGRVSKEPTKHSTRAEKAVSRFKGAPQQRRQGEKKREVERRVFMGEASFKLICQVTSNLYHTAEKQSTQFYIYFNSGVV